MKARLAIAAPATLLAAPALLALHFRDGPPARVTGGFGEDSCLACHSGGALNDSAGRLTLSGFPEKYQPGATYELELTLERQPLPAAAGFQLAVRLPDGKTQAGTLRSLAENDPRIGVLEERGVRFAHQRLAAVSPPDSDHVLWKLSWTAPETATEPVVIHAAAVAGDGDDSQLGDFVYVLEAFAEPAQVMAPSPDPP